MSRKDVFQTVKAVVPCAFMAWPEGSAPEPPYAVFIDDPETFAADDDTYAVAHTWDVELYEKSPDQELEQKLEKALRERFGTVYREEIWIEDENVMETVFSFSQTERVQ